MNFPRKEYIDTELEKLSEILDKRASKNKKDSIFVVFLLVVCIIPFHTFNPSLIIVDVLLLMFFILLFLYSLLETIIFWKKYNKRKNALEIAIDEYKEYVEGI